MVVIYHKQGEKTASKTSLNVDKETSEELGILSIKKGLTKKKLVKDMTKEKLYKEACTH